MSRVLLSPLWPRSRSSRRRRIVAGVALTLACLPLVGLLGYESSLILSPFFGIVAVSVAVDATREVQRGRLLSPESLGGISRRAGGELATLLAGTAGLLFLSGLWHCACDLSQGLLLFLLGPVVTAGLGAVAGVWGGTLCRRRWSAVLVGNVPFLFCLAVSLLRLYRDPAIFAHDPFWGRFAGAIYDEDVSIGLTYLLYRTYNVAVASLALLCWSRWVEVRCGRRAAPGFGTHRLLALLTIAVASIGLVGDRLGFHATRASVTRVLSGVHRTPHFTIHYEPGTPTAREIERIAREHEFAWSRITKRLGGLEAEPMRSYIFTTPEQKRRLMGAGDVEVAPPWRREIYLDAAAFPHPSLHHELAHILLGEFGDPLLGLSPGRWGPSMALVEGVAVALDPPIRDHLDLHDQAAILDRLGRRPDLETILGPGFWGVAAAPAYVAAGSFCLWILEREGASPLVELYRSGGDFDGVLGRTLSQVEESWLQHLRERDVSDADVESQRLRFQGRSIFRRPCAHRIAALSRETRESLGRGDVGHAVALQEAIVELEPGVPRHRLALARIETLDQRFEAAIPRLESLAADPDATVVVRSAAAELLGDAALQGGDQLEARRWYSTAGRFPRREAGRRVLQLKMLAVEHDELRDLLEEYFGTFQLSRSGTGAVVRRLDRALALRRLPRWKALGSYLAGRSLMALRSHRRAVLYLEEALSLEASLPGPEFRRAARLALVAARCRHGDLDGAEAALAGLRGGASGHRATRERWAERIRAYRQLP